MWTHSVTLQKYKNYVQIKIKLKVYDNIDGFDSPEVLKLRIDQGKA
jgi:hypothetical protein